MMSSGLWRGWVSALLICGCLFLSPAPAFPFPASVKTVLDGDTIILTDGTRIRYAGINTPEHGQPFYAEAKQFNVAFVRGKQVEIVSAQKKRESYGRELAYVFVDGGLINARLIEAGFAYIFTFGAFPYEAAWRALQQRAQEQRKGLWQAGIAGPLKITTVRADARGDDRKNLNGEYVRVCNVSPGPLDLAGFRITDAASHAYAFPSGVLAPGYTALVLSGTGQDTSQGGQLILHWGARTPIWNNTGDTAFLFNPDDTLIDTFQIQTGFKTSGG